MHLRSIAMKGFKSFPSRTKLDFGPGVSVIVGPNGSGKSNITDGVLWALGEQSPLAVRGSTMKDVIFAGGHGVGGSSSAEVEVVIDNSDGALPTDFSEISIVRKLDRDGEGEYRLNGARCRLVDVLEVLSDSGLGKEMHSVVSQGKVEAIVLSRPRERRLMIEEAAGLGKHRKRRRRAQLKLERTEENLSRSLDVEREARSRLRPLKRQAEAAELHERIERQSLEARMTLTADAARRTRAELVEAETRARAAATERDEAERLLGEVAARREAAEQAFAAHNREREQVQSRRFDAGSAADRIQMRLERVRDQGSAAEDRGRRRQSQLEVMEAEGAHAAEEREAMPDERLPEPPRQDAVRDAWDALIPAERVRAIELELARLDADADERRAQELAGLESELEQTRGALEELEQRGGRAPRGARGRGAHRRRGPRRAARGRARRGGRPLRGGGGGIRAGRPQPAGARRGRHRAGRRARAGGGDHRRGRVRARTGRGPRVPAHGRGRGGPGRRRAAARPEPARGRAPRWSSSRAHGRPAGQAPVPGATRLLAHVRPEARVAKLADRLLGDVWVVDSLKPVSGSFRGVAVTRGGRLLDGATGELSQAPPGGGERLLAELGRREEIVAASERAAASEREARAEVERAAGLIVTADTGREEAETALRQAGRELAEGAEAAERLRWLLERRREAPGEGPDTVRRAELSADLRAERHLAERAEREREGRIRGLATLRAGIEADRELVRAAARAAGALEAALRAVEAEREALGAQLAAGAATGEETAPPSGHAPRRRPSSAGGSSGAATRSPPRRSPPSVRAIRPRTWSGILPSWPRASAWRPSRRPSPCPRRSAPPSRRGWSACSAGVSSSAR